MLRCSDGDKKHSSWLMLDRRPAAETADASGDSTAWMVGSERVLCPLWITGFRVMANASVALLLSLSFVELRALRGASLTRTNEVEYEGHEDSHANCWLAVRSYENEDFRLRLVRRAFHQNFHHGSLGGSGEVAPAPRSMRGDCLIMLSRILRETAGPSTGSFSGNRIQCAYGADDLE